ncbi:MAG: T9SS type A sorting domain-containing protein [Bacteroidales bacterium]|nr:T9SS type A sorting domain-containing protein [Bacteroidales bacterium]
MKTQIIAFLFLLPVFVFAQNTQEIISSSGGFGEGTNSSVSYTIGDIVTETSTDESLTQGFQQPNISVTEIVEAPFKEISVSVFPNPSIDFVNVKLINSETEMIVELLDSKGAMIEIQLIPKDQALTQFYLGNLPGGTYYLKTISKNEKYFKSFKIEKLN